MAIQYLKKSPKTSSTDDSKTTGIVQDLLKNIENTNVINVNWSKNDFVSLLNKLIESRKIRRPFEKQYRIMKCNNLTYSNNISDNKYNLFSTTYIDRNILDRDLFQHFATELNFNIIDMFEYYYDNTGENPFEDENYQKAIFCWYMCDMFEKIIMITYQYEIEDLDTDTEEEEPVYNDPSDLGVGDIIVPSAYDLQFG